MRNLIITILLFLPSIIMAQSGETVKLNTVVKSKTVAETDYRFIDLNKEAFTKEILQKGNSFLFEIDDKLTQEYEITRVNEYTPGVISVIAKEKGGNHNSFSFSYANGKIDGLMHIAGKENLYLTYENRENSNYISTKPAEIPLDLKHDGLLPDISELKSTAKSKLNAENVSDIPTTAAMEAFMDKTVTIDLMIVYTTAAKDWVDENRTSIEQHLAQAMNLSQIALDNSETGIELRLVHTHHTDYDELNDGVDSDKRLRRLTNTTGLDVPSNDDSWKNTSGYMRDVHILRTQYGADLVAMVALIEDTGGIAWILSSPGGSPMWGFSVNRVQQIANGYTLVHEIGHNMGNNHSRTQESAAASNSGGLFQYSAGYQDKANGVNTIMAYPDGLEEIPYFSSPNLYYNDKPLGVEGAFTPTDNARSMTEIKYVVSQYRPTKVDAPVIGTLDNSVSVTMNREDNLTHPIAIDNNGESTLTWSADLAIPRNRIPKVKSKTGGLDFKSHVEFEGQTITDNLGFVPQNNTKNKAKDKVLYSTSFETSEGFAAGKHVAINQWRALGSGENSINITNSNPKSGNTHFRLDSRFGGSTQFVESPYFGALPFGTYEIEMDLDASGNDALKDRYDIYIYDGKTGQMSGGVVITASNDGLRGGVFYVWKKGEDGEYQFYSTNGALSPNGYTNFKVKFDASNETVTYYLDDVAFSTVNYAVGRTPGYVRVLHHNSIAGTSIDIDNFKVTKIEDGYSWLKLNNYGGVVDVNSTENLNLEFSTRGVAAGEYETTLKLQTNDSKKTAIEIPVYLTVNTTVGAESNTELPKQVELKQNVPNPFNPATNINFTLTENTDVKLEVYTVQGQKVATLVNERMQMGTHDVRFDAANLASGVYLYRLITPNQVITKSMVLIK